MNPEQRLALLEAFARSKAYEFDGFTVEWLEKHPEPIDQRFQSDDDATLTIGEVEEKPKRKRKQPEVNPDV